MASTFFSHRKTSCRGAVVIDLSPCMKMVAPAFTLNTNGVGGTLADLRFESGKSFSPIWTCAGCGETPLNVDTDLEANCMVCGAIYPVDKLFVSDQIACICESCKSGLVSKEAPAKAPQILLTYRSVFNAKVPFIRMSEALRKPITL